MVIVANLITEVRALGAYHARTDVHALSGTGSLRGGFWWAWEEGVEFVGVNEARTFIEIMRYKIILGEIS